MTLRVAKYALLVSGLTLSGSLFAGEMPPMLAQTCVGCHGPNGSSVGPATPSIAGTEEETFVEAMRAYQKDERPSTIMGRIAKGYTDQELEIMANYFSSQEFVRYPQETDATKVNRGKALHDEYCDKCHEDNGFKDEDGSSILAGQWLPYLQFSLADYHSSQREPTKKMGKRLSKMVKEAGEGSLDDIAHFYASQTKK